VASGLFACQSKGGYFCRKAKVDHGAVART
jgi:hypothetical protein